jgi:hypothetical protein
MDVPGRQPLSLYQTGRPFYTIHGQETSQKRAKHGKCAGIGNVTGNADVR